MGRTYRTEIARPCLTYWHLRLFRKALQFYADHLKQKLSELPLRADWKYTHSLEYEMAVVNTQLERLNSLLKPYNVIYDQLYKGEGPV